MGKKVYSLAKEFLISKLKWGAPGTDIVVVDLDIDKELGVYVDELESKIGEFDIKIGEFCLTQSNATVLITTWHNPLDLF